MQKIVRKNQLDFKSKNLTQLYFCNNITTFLTRDHEFRFLLSAKMKYKTPKKKTSGRRERAHSDLVSFYLLQDL